MNQQNQGSGSSAPSNVPKKRKRGRPRKEESAVQGGNSVSRGSDNVVNSNQTEGTTDGAGDEMVGKVVTGVIDGAFGAGYLLNVRVADTETYLRGAVFLPDRVAPVTAENDVAPHLPMVQRKDIPVPVLNLQPQMQSSIPSSRQGSKQPAEPKPLVPSSEDQVLPAEIHSGTSVSLDNQSASVAVPMVSMPKNDTTISGGEIPQELLEAGHESQSASIMSGMECDKIVEQNVTLHKLDSSAQLREPNADVGAENDSQPTSESINLLLVTENIDEELLTGQQAASSVHKLNEPIHDEPKNKNIELNEMPVSSEPDSMPYEDNFVDQQGSPKTDILLGRKTELASDISNIVNGGPNSALETSHPSTLFEGEAVPSESKFASEGSNLPDASDPQNRSPSGEITEANATQRNESSAKSVEPENPIGQGSLA